MKTIWPAQYAPLRERERPLRVTHVIGSLHVGGAERALVNLTLRCDPRAVANQIITLMPGGPFEQPLTAQGVPLESLQMRRGGLHPRALGQLADRLRHHRPDVIVSWMYHANLVAGLAARWAGGIPVVWNIRHTHLDRQRSKRATRWVARLGGWLSSSLPRRIVYVAEASQRHHQAHGYAADRGEFIPNGFDVEQFRPRGGARERLCHTLGLTDATPLVGMIGRLHPDKDHAGFLAAAARVHRRRPDVHFVLCGQAVDPRQRSLTDAISQLGIRDVVHLLGPRNDVPEIAAGLDLFVSSSLTEAFPQAVGEAMASAVPCVVTDVGDSRLLVGETGRVVPAANPLALSQACLDLLALPTSQRRVQGQAARQRIMDHFHLRDTTDRHLAVWREVAATKSVPPRGRQLRQAA